MNKRKLEVYEIVLGVLMLIVIVAGLMMPKTGRFVLADEVCDIIVIWIGCILVTARIVRHGRASSFTGKMFRGIVVIMLLALSLWFAKDVALDVVSGPESTVLSNLEESQTQAHTGVFSRHYYVMGTDVSGKYLRLEISGKDYSELSGHDKIKMKYYRNTSRVVEFW